MLLLAFFQKLGLELWLHHWLHEPREGIHLVVPGTPGVTPEERDNSTSLHQSPISCNCLDDTLMPQIEPAPFHYEASQKHLIALLREEYSSILSSDKIFSALRGPPTA